MEEGSKTSSRIEPSLEIVTPMCGGYSEQTLNKKVWLRLYGGEGGGI